MEAVLKKAGKSTVVVLPRTVLKKLGLGVGQRMSLEVTADGSIVLSAGRKHALADLIAQCNLKASPPADLALWKVARPIGQELW
jgi:antitoxin ChpS